MTREELDVLIKDDNKAQLYFENRRWPHGIKCPYCNGEKIGVHKEPKRKTIRYNCLNILCQHSFSVKTRTMFHGTRVELRKWIQLLDLVFNHTDSMPSIEHLASCLGVTRNAIYNMMAKLNAAHKNNDEYLIKEVMTLLKPSKF